MAHVFKAGDSFIIPGRGRVFTGPWPLPTVKKTGRDHTQWAPCMNEPWAIEHAEANPAVLYRVTGVESFAVPMLSSGMSCGLLARPWDEARDGPMPA